MPTRHSFLSTTGLIRHESITSLAPSTRHARSGSTRHGKQLYREETVPEVATSGIVPLRPSFVVGIAVLFSLVFVASISMAFIGSEDGDEPEFKSLLDTIAITKPGIILLGENVDIDVDEPSVGLRWSIVGCGTDFVLSGSEGMHGSSSCGLPGMPLDIFVDSDPEAAAKYDPSHFTAINGTGQRLSIQALFQFDSDHVLDVHKDYLYPFDTYCLTTTLRATSVGNNNTDPIPINALTAITKTSSFVVEPQDVDSYALASDGTHVPSRDITLLMRRPAEARGITMLLFSVSWMLTHSTMGFVGIAWFSPDGDRIRRYLAFIFVIILAIPELRNTMPDAPGFDGVLLDSIGFFPQMVITASSAIVLLLMIAKRELDISWEQRPRPDPPQHRPGLSLHFAKEVRNMRRAGTSIDFREARSWR